MRDTRSITATRSSHKVQGVLEGCLRGRLSAARSSMISIDRRRLNRELNRLLGPQAMSRAASCGATISVRARDKVLMFLTCRDVEATNNESERALPPLGDLPQSDERVPLGMRRPRSTPTAAGHHRPPRIDSHRDAAKNRA